MTKVVSTTRFREKLLRFRVKQSLMQTKETTKIIKTALGNQCRRCAVSIPPDRRKCFDCSTVDKLIQKERKERIEEIMYTVPRSIPSQLLSKLPIIRLFLLLALFFSPSLQGQEKPIGFVDGYSCSSVFGWSADLSKLSSSIDVFLFRGPSLHAFRKADSLRPDVGTFLKDNGRHGYTFQGPFENGSYSVRLASGFVIGSFTLAGCQAPSAQPDEDGVKLVHYVVGDKLVLGGGLQTTQTERGFILSVDMTMIVSIGDLSKPCPSRLQFSYLAGDLYACAPGAERWRKVRLE